MTDALYTLLRRIERLEEKRAMQAPQFMIDQEIDLVIEAAKVLKKAEASKEMNK